MQKQEFYIEQIIALVREQEPERLDVIEKLEKSEKKKWIRQPYIYFVEAENPNQEDSEWQFDENIVLECETEGTIVLDILKDGRIGGIEFVSLL
ncbi:hypothetical protein [Flammeovirga sp. SJP92]|uniref:hypothetical protein n=1 Tax=Flammeovirga sp. SJP92 TaxID=1775430 RepID=UPI000788B148|nr:hypothetical protein [Flammeovirga sp. SJP92]KXX71065.1 hypothetical protein AVL50_10715 [Flammeovirga sp. SJP92]